VICAGQANVRNRRAFEARQQDPPQAVANSGAEAALERLDRMNRP
jgi:hypothetical protein